MSFKSYYLDFVKIIVVNLILLTLAHSIIYCSTLLDMGSKQARHTQKSSNIPILLCMLLGIFWVAINVSLFFYAQVQGVLSGIGLIGYLTELKLNQPVLLGTIIVADLVLLFSWPLMFCFLVYRYNRELISSIKQMIVGWCVLLAFIGIIVCLTLISIFHQGRVGDVASFILSLLCTPFTMEFLLGVLGVCLVIALNTIRQKLDGDEYVEMIIEE